MRKQEYIHLHALLAEVSNDLRERGSSVDLDSYETLGIRPTAIHQSKDNHKEAVQALASGIVDAVAEESERKVSARA